MESTSKVDNASKMESTSKMEVPSRTENTSKMESSSKMESALKLEGASKTVNTSKMESTSKMEGASRTVNTSKMESVTKTVNISQMESTSKMPSGLGSKFSSKVASAMSNKSSNIIRKKKRQEGVDGSDESQTHAVDNVPTAKTVKSRSVAHWQSKVMSGISATVLSAYMGFKDPKKRRREFLIPKDKAAWLEWMVHVAKKRVKVQYLTDKELRKVIIRARPNLGTYRKITGPSFEDPDLPPCWKWNATQVAEWIGSAGWPELKETFVGNMITGRKLVLIDCSALCKMGMTDLGTMKLVAEKIRELLGLPPPNQYRAISRVPPFELYLRRKVYSGSNYDDITFEMFCDMEGFNYGFAMKNRNMRIPCTVEVVITENADAEEDEGDSDGEHSLRNAPTVEFLVRNALIRNKIIDQIMEDILESVILPASSRKYGRDVWGTLKRVLGEGYDDLHLHYPKQKLDFASEVAHALIDELYKTAATLNDIAELEKHINENISQEDMKMFRKCGQTLVDEAIPLVGLMMLGEFDLETIFKQEPTFLSFVDQLAEDAENKINASQLIFHVCSVVDEIIAQAIIRVYGAEPEPVSTDPEAQTVEEPKKSLVKLTSARLPHMKFGSSVGSLYKDTIAYDQAHKEREHKRRSSGKHHHRHHHHHGRDSGQSGHSSGHSSGSKPHHHN